MQASGQAELLASEFQSYYTVMFAINTKNASGFLMI